MTYIQCNAMQCNAMQCNAMQCNAVQCNAMQCNTRQYNTRQYSIVYIYSTVQYNTYSTMQLYCKQQMAGAPQQLKPITVGPFNI
jgi:hypothetical protein